MQTILQKILLFFLRLLVYVKRLVFWFFRKAMWFFDRFSRMYRLTIGYRVYRAILTSRRSFGHGDLLNRGQMYEFVGGRWVLQWLAFLFMLGVMIPESKLYTATEQSIPGQKKGLLPKRNLN